MRSRAGTRVIFVCLIAAVFGAPVVATNASAQPVPHRTVLTIHSGAETFPSNPLLDAGIREALGSRSDLAIDDFAEYLEADLFPADRATLAFRDYLRTKYEGRRIDVVIAITGAGLQFALDHRDELFPGAPIVFGGLVSSEVIGRAGGNLTGLRFGVAYAETLKLALALHPGTRRVFVVAQGPAEQIESVRAELRGVTGVAFTYVNEPTLSRLLEIVRAIPPRSVILYIWHSQLEAGHVLYPDRIAPLIVRAAEVPVYGTSDLYLGSGVVGGVVRDTYESGTHLGEMAVKILAGTRPQDMPIEAARLVPVVDWRQVRRWGIDPSRLPAGTEVRFRTATAWETYRWYVIGTIAVIGAQLLLIAALLTQARRRRRAEHVVRWREATLRNSYEEIRKLNARLIHAQEAARAEIASELHDDVCQQLVAVTINVSDLKGSSGQLQDAPAQSALSKLYDSMRDMVNGVRRLSHDLHPATLRLVGLAAALRSHCIEVEEQHDVQVSFQTNHPLRDLHPDIALCLFRIAQEALRNGAVHGNARRLAVSITRSGDVVEMMVTDDGKGFDLVRVRHGGSGLGLVSMEERARAVGGNIQIASQPGRGTTIRVRVQAKVDVEPEYEGV